MEPTQEKVRKDKEKNNHGSCKSLHKPEDGAHFEPQFQETKKASISAAQNML
jgi:hypothetical protein